ncbi:MAG: helix-turn-helix transcriptional regulator [Pseudomonas sp.]|nr:helix-turn-helix transcriptional regulator [Pseudomonas sp.]
MHLEVAQRCLQAFTQLVPARQAAFYCIDEQLQACDFQLLHMNEAMHRDYLANYRQVDPLHPRRCLASGLAVVPLHVARQQQRPADGQRYQRFLTHYGVVDVVEIIAQRDGKPHAAISMLRGPEQGAFTVAQLSQLHALQGLLEMAVATLPAPQPALTPREQQIALLLSQGASNKDLARQLDLGLATVKTHLIHLFRKVGVRNRTELVSRLYL